MQTVMNGPWCVRVISAIGVPENPEKFYVHLCSSFVNTSSSRRRIAYWLIFCIALYPEVKRFTYVLLA